MQEYEYYKTAWEKAVSERTKLRDERIAVLEAEITILEKENARYRDALEDIVHCIYSNEATLAYCEKKAREALKGGE